MISSDYSRRFSYRLRWLTVILSAILSASLVCSYIALDVYDVLPGPLTVSAQKHATVIQNPQGVRSVPYFANGASDGSPINQNEAKKLIKELVETAGVGNDVSVVIADASGKVVASHAPDIPREPASTMKTLTADVATHVLDMGSTLDTTVYLSNNNNSHIVLKGNGDMLLGVEENDIKHVNGRAGLKTLAEKTAKVLKSRGISEVSLSVDDSLFGSKRFPSLVSENDSEGRFYAPTSSMAIDCARQRDFAQWVKAGFDADDLDDYPILDKNPAEKVGKTFSNLLSKQGVQVNFSGDISKEKSLITNEYSPIAHISSATLGEILRYMLRRSDNTLAEEFGRLIALARGKSNSPEGGTIAVKESLRELGISTNGLHMSDCSGLSPKSTVLVTTLVQAQADNLRSGSSPAAAQGLSIPGFIGSARKRLQDDSIVGMLRVKTGALEQVTSMSGNVTRKKGGTLTFAVIINNPTDYWLAFNSISQFIKNLPEL